MLVGIANVEDPDLQKQSDLSLRCLSMNFSKFSNIYRIAYATLDWSLSSKTDILR